MAFDKNLVLLGRNQTTDVINSALNQRVRGLVVVLRLDVDYQLNRFFFPRRRCGKTDVVEDLALFNRGVLRIQPLDLAVAKFFLVVEFVLINRNL